MTLWNSLALPSSQYGPRLPTYALEVRAGTEATYVQVGLQQALKPYIPAERQQQMQTRASRNCKVLLVRWSGKLCRSPPTDHTMPVSLGVLGPKTVCRNDPADNPASCVASHAQIIVRCMVAYNQGWQCSACLLRVFSGAVIQVSQAQAGNYCQLASKAMAKW